jgi:hypothetical protein
VAISTLRGTVHELTPKGKSDLVKLVGEQCVISAEIDSIAQTFLWDTGAQCSLLSRSWLETNFPHKNVRPIQDLFHRDLPLSSASGSELGVEGYVEFEFTFGGQLMNVPFVVTNVSLEQPILGYNVIAHLVNHNPDACSLSSVFQGQNRKTVDSVVKTVKQR